MSDSDGLLVLYDVDLPVVFLVWLWYRSYSQCYFSHAYSKG